MKIKVSYSELKSDGNFGHKKAEAEIEFEVPTKGDLQTAYDKAWGIVKGEVKRQLDPAYDDSLPF